MMKKLKEIFEEHYNCLPWFVCGLIELIQGDITRFEFFCIWMALLILIWFRIPVKEWGK